MTTAHAYELPSGELSEALRGAFDDAENGDVAYVTHGRHRLAIVLEQVAAAGAAAVQALEDAEDNAAADAALAEGGEPIPWEQVKAELRELEAQGR